MLSILRYLRYVIYVSYRNPLMCDISSDNLKTNKQFIWAQGKVNLG